MIKLTRRELMLAAGAAAPSLIIPRAVFGAAAFPAKPINFIIPYAPGGGFDVYVRVVAPVMEKYLPNKVSIVPMNIAAGGGSRGVAQLYRAKPDGYTIGILNIPGMFILQQQQGTGAYDLSKFSWIGTMGEGERYAISVGAKSPLKSFADLKALSAKRPVKFSVTGPEGTAYAATMIGTQLLGITHAADQRLQGFGGLCRRGHPRRFRCGDRGHSRPPCALCAAAQVRVLASFETHSSIPGVPDATSLGQPELDQISVERLVGAPPGLPAALQNTFLPRRWRKRWPIPWWSNGPRRTT